jgi:segregation and condensation protein B
MNEPLDTETENETSQGEDQEDTSIPQMQAHLETETDSGITPDQLDFAEIESPGGARLPLRNVLEALLFAASAPLSLEDFVQVLKEYGSIRKKTVRQCLESMQGTYPDSSFELVEVFGGYQFRTRADFGPWIRKLLSIKKKERLSKSALETLSIIAYKQPVTRAEIEAIRGVSVDSIMRVLLEKELILE